MTGRGLFPARIAGRLRHRLLRSRVDLVACAVLVALSFVVFRRGPNLQAGDSRYAMLLSENLLRHGDFELDRYRLPDSAYQIESVAGHRYYAFPPGTSVLSVPLVAALDLRGLSSLGPDGTYDLGSEQKIDAKLAALIMAGFAGLAYGMARLLLPVVPSALVALVSAFGTQVFSTTSRGMWSDTWGIVLVGGAAYLLLRSAARPDARLNLPLLATLEAWAYIVRPTNALVIVGTAIYLAWKRPRGLAVFLAAGAAWGALFVAYSWRHFHTILPSYFSAGRLRFADVPVALVGNLLSPGRGVLVYVPALLAVGLALIVHWREARFRPLLALALFIAVCHLTVLAGFGHWWGGHCYGARLTTSLVPWMVLAGVIAVDAFRRATREGGAHGRGALGVGIAAGLLCAASVAINARGAYAGETSRWNYVPENVDESPERLWDWRHPQFLAGLGGPLATFLPLPAQGLRLGTREADDYLGDGWAPHPEQGTFRWTDGPRATVRFAFPRGTTLGVLELDLRPYLPPGPGARQRLTVWLNMRELGHFTLQGRDFGTYAVTLPADVVQPNNVLELHLPDAVSPAAAEGAADKRALGVAVRTIRLGLP